MFLLLGVTLRLQHCYICTTLAGLSLIVAFVWFALLDSLSRASDHVQSFKLNFPENFGRRDFGIERVYCTPEQWHLRAVNLHRFKC